jgi:hypothetical protein
MSTRQPRSELLRQHADVVAAAEPLFEVPEAWRWRSLAALGEIVGGLTKGQKRRSGDRLCRIPYLRVANVQRGHLDLAEMKEIDATEDEIKELRLVPGDVLFTEAATETSSAVGGSGRVRFLHASTRTIFPAPAFLSRD